MMQPELYVFVLDSWRRADALPDLYITISVREELIGGQSSPRSAPHGLRDMRTSHPPLMTSSAN
jgi:hypothetical protein